MTAKQCLFCHIPLTGKQRNYCSDAHRKAYERQKERLDASPNLQPQPQNGPKADNLRIPDVDLSGLASVFSPLELQNFSAHVLGMADYERVWYERTLEDLAHTPGPKHINDPLPPEYRRLTRVLERYQKSEAIFRWIAHRVIEAIGQEVKPYRSPCYGGMECQIINGKLVTNFED